MINDPKCQERQTERKRKNYSHNKKKTCLSGQKCPTSFPVKNFFSFSKTFYFFCFIVKMVKNVKKKGEIVKIFKLNLVLNVKGLRDLGKYKLSSDYWENWSLV